MFDAMASPKSRRAASFNAHARSSLGDLPLPLFHAQFSFLFLLSFSSTIVRIRLTGAQSGAARVAFIFAEVRHSLAAATRLLAFC